MCFLVVWVHTHTQALTAGRMLGLPVGLCGADSFLLNLGLARGGDSAGFNGEAMAGGPTSIY